MSEYRRRLLMNSLPIEESYSVYVTTEANQTIQLISTSFDVSKIDRVIVYDTNSIIASFVAGSGVSHTFPRVGSHKVKIKLKVGTNNFQNLFYDCTALTNIQNDIFDVAENAGTTDYMFSGVFSNTKLSEIPQDLFLKVSGNTTLSMFSGAFRGCPIKEIPVKLFSTIRGTIKDYMFNTSFYGCSNLETLPEDLFSYVQSTAIGMFRYTFFGCKKLKAIPELLFCNVIGYPKENMFAYTFYGCSDLSYLPTNMLSGINGAPAASMYNRTFSACASLTEIPVGIFGNISGASATSMYEGTFYRCSNLSKIPDNLFGNLTGTADNMFYITFGFCSSLTGQSASLSDGTKLYEKWSDEIPFNITTQGETKSGCYYLCTGLSDYTDIPDFWKKLDVIEII